MRVLLCNNNGGMEFKFGNLEQKTDVSSFIAADNHFSNSKGWAETNGFIYYPVSSKEEFDAVISKFVMKSESPIMIEIFTSPNNEREAQGKLKSENWHGTEKEIKAKALKDNLKDTIEGVVGEKGVKIIKRIIKR